ncbi:MAG: replication-relaxation family protein [Anaerolineaceae bacterium]|nr:replication-relaxation family protein [Anaerolineaceae bacterium]
MAAIHSFEGVMTHSQIVRLCFPGCTSSWPLERMQHYFDHRLIKKIDAYNVNGRFLGEMIYTLDTYGAYTAARFKEAEWSDFKWRRKPRWITLIHDLAINDVRLSIVEACREQSSFSLLKWISEYELSQVSPRIPGRLDSFFVLQRDRQTNPSYVEQLALHLEIDTGNHPIKRFISRKVKPILKFFGTDSYADFFGVREGVCLIATSSEKRLHNLKKAIEENGGAGLFYLTTMEAISKETVLATPIWRLAGSDASFSLENLPLSPVDAGVLNNFSSTRYRQTVLPI